MANDKWQMKKNTSRCFFFAYMEKKSYLCGRKGFDTKHKDMIITTMIMISISGTAVVIDWKGTKYNTSRIQAQIKATNEET